MANNYILTDNNEGKILPRLNTLTWVKTSPVTDMPAFDNRLLSEEDYPNYVLLNEHQKFDITNDLIFIQITTNYLVKNVILVNEATLEETDLTGVVAQKSTAWEEITSWNSVDWGTLTVYNKTIYTTLLSGTYHMRLELNEESSAESGNDELIYTSNTFLVGNYSDYIKMTWSHSVTGLKKGIYWSGVENFMSRIDARFIRFGNGINLELNESWNSVLEMIDGDSKLYAIMQLSNLSGYFLEKLGAILQIDTKLINEEQYEVEDGIEAQIIGDDIIIISLYKGSLKWRKKYYEKYQNFEAEAEVETYYGLYDENDGIGLYGNDVDDYGTFK
jgi:hypothetical protein